LAAISPSGLPSMPGRYTRTSEPIPCVLHKPSALTITSIQLPDSLSFFSKSERCVTHQLPRNKSSRPSRL
jgi:hypothetical protein